MATQTGKDGGIPGTGGQAGTRAGVDVVGWQAGEKQAGCPIEGAAAQCRPAFPASLMIPAASQTYADTLAASPRPALRSPQGLAGAGPPESKSVVQEGQKGAAGAPSAETQAKYGDVDKVRSCSVSLFFVLLSTAGLADCPGPAPPCAHGAPTDRRIA